MRKERWVVLEEFPKYSVSDQGRVRRDAAGTATCPGKILNPWITPRGYCAVTLRNEVRRKSARVHQLVLGAFVGPCPRGWVIDHIDTIKDNNALSNLEYVTRAENAARAVANGLNPRGTQIGLAKLTDARVSEARRRAKRESIRSLALAFGVSISTLAKAVRGETWEHVRTPITIMPRGRRVRPPKPRVCQRETVTM